MAIGGIVTGPAVADDGTPSAEKTSSLGVTIGTGTTVTTTVTLNQRDVYAKAIARVVKWRRDALNDTRIKFRQDSDGRYVTVAQYLKSEGISQAEYLSPKWSNALERIAVQRTIEAADYSLGHTRPNGTDCFTAYYGEDSSFNEVLAWGAGDADSAIDLWASEKDDYVKQVAGQSHSETGHYVMLVNPDAKWYGFGVLNGVAAGEASWETVNQSQAPTNWSGTKTVEVNVSNALIGQGVTSNLPGTMSTGQKVAAVARLKYMNGRYHFSGTWTSSNPSVASVSNGNVVTAHKTGTATISVSGQGKTYSFKVTVANVTKVPVYRVYNRNSGLHHYTTSLSEKNMLVGKGWRDEGVSFNAAKGGSLSPVYREYNPNNGNHNWTTNKNEHDMLVARGWRNEGVAWYVSPSAPTNVYRLYNPNSGEHVYTTSFGEYQSVGYSGWHMEGIAWKSL